MKWKLLTFSAVGLVAVLAGLALRSSATLDVAGHRFSVPREWLFNARIAWLPAPDAEGFTFHLDPVHNRNEIPPHLVTVEAAKNVCRPDGQSQIVRVACGRERTSVRVGPPYQKVFSQPDYRTEWDYYSDGLASDGRQPSKLQVAWCTPIEPNPARPKGTAICTSVWGVEGLILSLGFEENELSQLPAMRDKATRMLLSWKAR